MRKKLVFLMVMSVKLAFGQVNDDFSDGDFTTNPSWTGHHASFYVNSAKQLQTSLSVDSKNVSLAVPNMLATNTQWEFYIQLNFDPSASNQARIYLIADAPDLTGPINGYFIQVGEAGSSDSYDLYKQTGTGSVKIIDGLPKPRANANMLVARIRVIRTDVGKWELYTDVSGAYQFMLEGTATDTTHLFTDWFGVCCSYTPTRSNGFIFDDFKVTALSPDLTKPALFSAKALDAHTINVVFTERVDLTSALMASNYILNKIGAPTSVQATNAPNVFKLNYANTLISGDYKLTAKFITDLSGNVIDETKAVSFFYLVPYQLKKGDLMISEILVNPKTGGVDFVEIYNATQQIIDLSALKLANVDIGGNIATIKNVSSTPVYLPAQSYWVLTSNPTIIQQQYAVRYPLQMTQMSMPSYNNTNGSVVIMTTDGILERFDYGEKMHLTLLRDVDGVSLERISFTNAVNEPGNFQSAAQSVGFATPTYRNSQQEQHGVAKDAVNLPSKTFSPDGDGFEDELQIDYQFVKNGNLATVTIYTDKGVLIRKLERNTTIATEGSFKWDGKDDHGQIGKVGIYVIKFDAFNLNGETKRFKKIAVLATKLN